ncbi:hypothetical protein K491DRAFT_696198, partial [Lophiostoma macrostomum CBS 122681]
MMSGGYLLPTVLPELFMAATAGPLVMETGYVIPIALISTVLLSISSGLYSI